MKLFSVLAVGLMLAGPVSAQDRGKAIAAFNAGDYATALQEWEPLAAQGDAAAQYKTGFIYSINQDSAEAAKWFRLAAEQGYSEAQVKLSVAFGGGFGVPQDFVTAHMWANIGAANGHEDGSMIRDMVAAQMTPAAVEEAQRRARVCMASNYQDCD